MNVVIENLYKDYEGKVVLDNISGRINAGEKIGLIGSNGVGKTTLAKLIAGQESFEKGAINYSPAKGRIVYLSQSFLEDGNYTIEEHLRNSHLSDYEDNVDVEKRKLLREMGITEEIWSQPLDTFSGGEKTKLMLAKVLVQYFELLILDEPTNHLDMESRDLLEKLLSKLKKTVLIISHDRYFIDKTVSKVWELSSKELKEYSGNYTSYKMQKEIEIKNNFKEYEKQQKQIEHLNGVINKRKEWFTKAHKAAGQDDFLRGKSKKHVSVMRSKERQLERLEKNKIELMKEEMVPYFEIINKNVINVKLPEYIVQVRKLGKSYGSKVIFQDISFEIKRGDKTGILGRNGSGKTTLLNIINALDSEFKGDVYINPAVKIAYFSQQLEMLDYNKTVLDNVLSEGITQTEARTLLAGLLFRGEEAFKSVKVLSMGEKCRVAIAKLILSGANLLILDEPTNYMDIASKEKIEEVLKVFKGSILFVSHDRYFVNSIASKLLELESKKISTYLGNYDFYLAKKEEARLGKSMKEDFKTIVETITKYECELAFIGGRLNEKLTEEEKESLNKRFIEVARELRVYKEKTR
jgi:ATP-binding cassette, subfamily F, member 3